MESIEKYKESFVLGLMNKRSAGSYGATELVTTKSLAIKQNRRFYLAVISILNLVQIVHANKLT